MFVDDFNFTLRRIRTSNIEVLKLPRIKIGISAAELAAAFKFAVAGLQQDIERCLGFGLAGSVFSTVFVIFRSKWVPPLRRKRARLKEHYAYSVDKKSLSHERIALTQSHPQALYFIGRFVMRLCQSSFDKPSRRDDIVSVLIFQSCTKYFVN